MPRPLLPTALNTFILLLGHQNAQDGRLSPVARSRCDRAIHVYKQDLTVKIIPTGGFGRDFNVSSVPHWQHLKRYLLSCGVDPSSIQDGIMSNRTLEDLYYARRVLVDQRARSVIIVTSDYHFIRTAFIAERVLPDLDITYALSSALPELKELRSEPAKRRREAGDWVDSPLYGYPSAFTTFPEETFKNCSDEQKQYDKISYLIVAGEFVCFAFPYTLGADWPIWIKGTAYILSMPLITLLMLSYVRLAMFANSARRIMALIEAQWTRGGFSLSALRKNFKGFAPAAVEHTPSSDRGLLGKIFSLGRMAAGIGFARSVMTITLMLIAIQIGAAMFFFCKLAAAHRGGDEKDRVCAVIFNYNQCSQDVGRRSQRQPGNRELARTRR